MKVSRRRGALIVTVLGIVIGIFCSLSFYRTEIGLFGMSLFDLFNFATGQIFLPLGGLFTCLFLGWYVPKRVVHDEFTNRGTLRGRFFGLYLFSVRFICPIAITLIFLHQFGVV